ncbi:hypothetical protein SAMD00019534_052720 [Acytostelium subglobosum LB1]|uniref:hypothetical protein n=1 Tax=Acytostelium subglobosum LB1 TaxID=1410327 RepID=UPI000644CC2E|nr:hypothetical protein SAMD00019534_052720 [Acytostelium subglobosum LB1]GAM22097.1 hypothetical protein SAMD00019534_052720 [Acytostelium subglobosum LB1]|eukprot:XP_012755197.1 hypothetical protein SAMD00019534_052720 [Acytostelium subglobosum LB1]
MLVIEEHKITSQLNDRLQQTSSTIDNIINEIKSINTLFKHTSTCKFDRDVTDTDDGHDSLSLAQSITSCTSLDQFMDQTFPTTATSTSNGSEITITDMALLTLVQSNVERMNNVQHLIHRPCTVIINSTIMNSIKEQLSSCFRIYEPYRKYTHDFDGMIMCIELKAYSLFSPTTHTWTLFEQEHEDVIVSNRGFAHVYARGNIYLFGGFKNATTYSRFSLADRKWHHQNQMVGVDDDMEGRENIGLCYNGDQLIYLVGGTEPDGTLSSRIDSFNIDTQRYTHIGDLIGGITHAFVALRNNVLHCIQLASDDDDDDDDDNINYQEIIIYSYDLITNKLAQEYRFPAKPCVSAVYDGDDKFHLFAKMRHHQAITWCGSILMMEKDTYIISKAIIGMIDSASIGMSGPVSIF